MADRVSGERRMARVETWTAKYSDSALEDESRYVKAVEDQRGRSTHWLRQTSQDVFRAGSLPERIVAPCFFYYAAEAMSLLANLFRGLNAEAHLCGYGGDQVMWNCGAPVCGTLLDRAARGNLVSAAWRAL